MSGIPYYSAHTGIRRDKDGNFEFFIVEAGYKHAQDGYWRFSTLADQKSAFRIGIHSPEELLHIAVHGEDVAPDIILAWELGLRQRDDVLKLPLRKTVAEHLALIHNIREYLGLFPIGLEKTPVYPIDPRLREYLQRQNAAPPRRQRTSGMTMDMTAEQYMAASDRVVVDPLLLSEESSGVTYHHDRLVLEGLMAIDHVLAIPEIQYTAPVPLTATPEPTVSETQPLRDPNGPRCKKCIRIRKKCNRQRPCQNCNVIEDCISEDEITKNRRLGNKLPIAKKTTKASKPSRASKSSKVRRGSKNDKVPGSEGVRWSNEIKEDNVPLGVEIGLLAPWQFLPDPPSDTSPNLQGAVAQHQEPSGLPPTTPHRSSVSISWRTPNKPEPFRLNGALVAPTTPSPSQVPHIWRMPQQSASSHSEQPSYVRDTSMPSSVQLHGENGTLEPLPYHSPYGASAGRPTAAAAEMQIKFLCASPASAPITVANGKWFPPEPGENPQPAWNPISTPHSTTVASQPKSVVNGTENLCVPHGAQGTVFETAPERYEKPGTQIEKVPIIPIIKPRLQSEDANTSEFEDTMEVIEIEETGTMAMPVVGEMIAETDTQAPIIGDISDPFSGIELEEGNASSRLGITHDLACIDCGQDLGHRWDCHIGNIEPMTNLTKCDFRALVALADRHDAQNFIGTYDCAASEVEDPETQIRGMAEQIRAEESYRNDAALHEVPDGLMVLLWAIKSADNMDIVSDLYEVGFDSDEST